jgi:eukaryotic-like serine/threonine-protein kinase
MTISPPISQTTMRDPVPTSARYECLVKVASGGMATVYVGRLRGKHGFSRLVAIKRAHAHLLDDDQLRRGLIGEARLAAQIHDPHVVSVLDVDEPGGELMLVMDYIEGGSLSQLLANASKRGERLEPGVVTRILLDACAGLAAAHELRDEAGQPLSIVHRDVSPHNILVGIDGLSRIADFGIAKWAEATQATSAGLKGKFSYMAPEYIKTRKLDHRADVFGLGVVAWEAFTGQRLFRGEGELETIQQVVDREAALVSSVVPGVPAVFDMPIARALEKDPALRYESARDFAHALQAAAESAGVDVAVTHVGEAVRHLLGDVLDARRVVLRDLSAGGSGASKGSPGSGLAGDHTEGVPTATATLDAAFATDARTLPIDRSPPSEKRGLAAASEPVVVSRAGLSMRGSLLVVSVTALAVVALAVVWSGRGTSGSPRPATPAVIDEAALSANPAQASAAGSTSASAALASAPSAAPSVAAPPVAGAPLRKLPRHFEAASAAPTAERSTAVPSTAASSAPGRPGLGY